jgi:hypothetical protein
MGDLSDFEKEQIVGARFAGASVATAATLLHSNGCCTAAYFWVVA